MVGETSRRRFVTGGSAAFGTIAVLKSPAKAAEFEFRCASNATLEDPSAIRQRQMWEAVKKETDGRLAVQFFPNNQLGGDAAMFSQLRLGALQFLFIGAGNLATVVPPCDIGYLGFAYSGSADGVRCMDGPLGGYLRQESAAKGIQVLRKVWDVSMLQVTSNVKPIHTPEDVRGFKIRVTASRITVDLWKTLNANPVSLSFSELYPALQTKVVDGAGLVLVTIEGGMFFQVQKYMSLTNHQWAGNWMIANGDVWKRLPPDIQTVVERNNIKYASMAANDVRLSNASLADKLARQGMIVNRVEPGPFRALLRPYYETWAKEFGSTEWGLLESSLGHRLT